MEEFPKDTNEISIYLYGQGIQLRNELIEYFSRMKPGAPIVQKWLREDIPSLKNVTLGDIRRLQIYLEEVGVLDRYRNFIFYTGKNLDK